MTEQIRAYADRQLPVGEEIFLDHVGHFVRDPQAASEALARVGFAPAPISIQQNPDGSKTGTGNVTAMLTRGYIEVLFKTADTPLGRELDAGIARYPGLHLVAFADADAARAHERLGRVGFATRPLVEMQRPVDTEQGPGVAAFTVTRVEPGVMPEGRIQVLTHRTEDTVWQPRWLSHPNGAIGLTHVVIVVDDIAEAGARFALFTDRPLLQGTVGASILLDRGRVDLVPSAAFEAVLPEIKIPSLPFTGAYGVMVRSLATVEKFLASAAVPTRRIGNVVIAVFPEELGHGAWLFSESSEATLFA